MDDQGPRAVLDKLVPLVERLVALHDDGTRRSGHQAPALGHRRDAYRTVQSAGIAEAPAEREQRPWSPLQGKPSRCPSALCLSRVHWPLDADRCQIFLIRSLRPSRGGRRAGTRSRDATEVPVARRSGSAQGQQPGGPSRSSRSDRRSVGRTRWTYRGQARRRRRGGAGGGCQSPSGRGGGRPDLRQRRPGGRVRRRCVTGAYRRGGGPADARGVRRTAHRNQRHRRSGGGPARGDHPSGLASGRGPESEKLL
jgi:hypothetical protein